MAGDPNRMVRAGDLILASDVRRLAGHVTRPTLLYWRKHKGFPEPVRAVRVGVGKRGQWVEIWYRPDVKRWLREHPASDAPIQPQRR